MLCILTTYRLKKSVKVGSSELVINYGDGLQDGNVG